MRRAAAARNRILRPLLAAALVAVGVKLVVAAVLPPIPPNVLDIWTVRR